jgi:iron complex transport system permease protein
MTTHAPSPTRRLPAWALYTLLGLFVLAVCTLSLFAGSVRVPLSEMATSPIVRLRIARIVLGLLAGAALSVAGGVFQALLRNPLAEPYVLGVSSGAGLGAAVAIVTGLAAAGLWLLPGAAFVGGLASVLVVYALARRPDGSVPMHSLLLSGVIVSTVLGSILMFLVSAAESSELHSVIWWLLGNLQVFNWALLYIVGAVIVAGVTLAVLFSRDLNLLTLGEEPATHLGLSVERAKLGYLALASLITGAAVSACGLIGFVGLIVPHTVRLLVGPDHRRLLPVSALAGGALLVLADTVARTLIAPIEIPIGVVTASIGGPFFLFFLRRRRRAYWA